MTQGEFSFRPNQPISKMEQRFRDFHAANPMVYELFKRFAFEAISAGRKRYSSDAVCHRIRWHVDIETRSDDGFKLNDHYTAFYARLFMEDHPQHAGFFETRRSKADAMEKR